MAIQIPLAFGIGSCQKHFVICLENSNRVWRLFLQTVVLFQVLLHSATVSTNFPGINIRWKGPPEHFFKNWYSESQSFKWKVMHTKISNLAISPLASRRLPGYIVLRPCGLFVSSSLLLHQRFQVDLLLNSPVEFPLALICYNNF